MTREPWKDGPCRVPPGGNPNKYDECILCGHQQPKRRNVPKIDPNGVGWTPCERGCEPPEGFPVDGTCAPLHAGNREQSIYYDGILDDYQDQDEEPDQDDDAGGESGGGSGPEADSPPDDAGEELSSGGGSGLGRRWTPQPRGGAPPRRR